MNASPPPRSGVSSTWLLGVLLCGLGVALFLRVQAWSERNEFARLDDLATRQLDLYVAALESELLRYADLPSVVSADPDVRALTAPVARPDSAMRERASRTLANIAVRAGTREIYVTDRADTVLAASDWNMPDSLYRRRLPLMPCASVTSGRARGFLFNSKSAAPEYYFVHAIGASIAEPGVPQACVVVKISLTPMESTWVDFAFRPDSEKIFVLDEHDVVILSSVPQWRFKTTDVFRAGRAAVRAMERATAYPSPVTPLEIDALMPIGRGAMLVSVADENRERAVQFVAHNRPLASTGWQVVMLTHPAEVRDNVRAVQLAAGAVLAFFGLLALYLHHRRRTMCQLLAARNALQAAHDQLEHTVALRTQELREANEGLLREMHERQQAEDELLQARKMAMLGQMSAKISHEISQPLTALRALATNSRAFLQQEKWSRVDENLHAIADIVARMGDITRQLKTFSGKTRRQAAPHGVVSLGEVMRAASGLLQERFEREGATLALPERPGYVRGDGGQLGQVFVNLFANALDALRMAPEKRIEVSVAEPAGQPRVEVRVRDTGPGIPADMRAHLFEPFYTSKPSGEGLGLGLVICASIVREHGGTLRAENADFGAEFTFDLERVDDADAERAAND